MENFMKNRPQNHSTWSEKLQKARELLIDQGKKQVEISKTLKNSSSLSRDVFEKVLLSGRWVFLDLELSGHADDNQIIEVGVIIVENDQIIDKKSHLVRPYKSPTARVLQLTGLKEDQLNQANYFHEEADLWQELFWWNSESGRTAVNIIAHGAEGDIKSLQEHLDLLFLEEWRPEWICTVDLAKIVSEKLNRRFFSYALDKLCKEFNIPLQRHHRALNDARATYQLFHQLSKLIPRYVDRKISSIIKRPKKKNRILKKEQKNELEYLLKDLQESYALSKKTLQQKEIFFFPFRLALKDQQKKTYVYWKNNPWNYKNRPWQQSVCNWQLLSLANSSQPVESFLLGWIGPRKNIDNQLIYQRMKNFFYQWYEHNYRLAEQDKKTFKIYEGLERKWLAHENGLLIGLGGEGEEIRPLPIRTIKNIRYQYLWQKALRKDLVHLKQVFTAELVYS